MGGSEERIGSIVYPGTYTYIQDLILSPPPKRSKTNVIISTPIALTSTVKSTGHLTMSKLFYLLSIFSSIKCV